VMEITTTHFLLPGKKHRRLKGTSINSFWNTNTGIFFRYKAPKTPACEAGSPDGYRDEYFGNTVAGKKPKLGNKMALLEVP
jgi:hypothetical protein